MEKWQMIAVVILILTVIIGTIVAISTLRSTSNFPSNTNLRITNNTSNVLFTNLGYLDSSGSGIFKYLTSDFGLPLILGQGQSVVIPVGNNLSSYTIIAADILNDLYLVTLCNINNSLTTVYGGLATSTMFTITPSNDPASSNIVTSPTTNNPTIISNPNRSIPGLLQDAIIASNGSASLPANSINYPAHLAFTSYNNTGAGYLLYTNNSTIPTVVPWLSTNVPSAAVSIGSIPSNGYVYVLAPNNDDTLSASLVYQLNGKVLYLYLFGGTVARPDYVVSHPSGYSEPLRMPDSEAKINNTIKKIVGQLFTKAR